MIRWLKVSLFIFICGGAGIPGAAPADIIQEAWYLMRSRANMEIGNYAAAIEAYEKYLEIKPDDREALKGIATAYEKQGQTDKAIARYDRYLELYHDDAEVAFKQAEYLSWSRYAYRKADAVKYHEMGLRVEDDAGQRLKYARLLSADKYDLKEAVVQYELLLKREPGNEALRAEFRNILLWDDTFAEKAVEQFELYVESNPQDFAARRQLAELLAKVGQREVDSARIYAQLVSEKPSDFKLRHDYVRVLARMPGRHQQANRQYQILMAEKPDYEILSEAALLLQNRPETHPQAIKIYGRMIGQRPDDSVARMKRAALYMRQESTVPEALRDYRQVVARRPRHAGAHQGIARALAWQGQSDEALYHAELAERYSGGNAEVAKLNDQLSRGREPRLTAILEIPTQSGSEFKLDGIRVGARFSAEFSPFISMHGEVGNEQLDSDGNDSDGSWWLAGGQYRPDSNQYIDFEIGNRSVREVGDSQTIMVAYTNREAYKPWTYSAGFARSLVDDSFLSLVGDRLTGTGGASRNEFYVLFEDEQNSRHRKLRPSIGWIESEAESSNNYLSVTGSLDYLTSLITRYKTRLGVAATYMSYSKDHSGFDLSSTEPWSGGYFSPQSYLDVLLYADFTHSLDNQSEWRVKLGPKLQYVDDASVAGEASSGFSGSISYTQKQSDSRYLILKAEHDSIGDRYRRSFLQGQIVLVF